MSGILRLDYICTVIVEGRTSGDCDFEYKGLRILDPQPRVERTYICTVIVEGRINIASGDYDFDIKGSGSSTVTVTGE